jgi:hypothetical protein
MWSIEWPPTNYPGLTVVVEDHEAIVSSRGKIGVIAGLPPARTNAKVRVEVRQHDPYSTRRR